MFERLREQVRADVEAADRMRSPEDSRHAFSFMSQERMFAAVVEGAGIRHVISFKLHDGFISVRDQERDLYQVTVNLNDEGRCVIRANAREYEPWQFRKLALESLLFTKY
jgi:hypothetical protein